jgi:hypothetical protein
MATYLEYQPKKYDNFKTPIEVWKNIQQFIPNDKKIWCPFYFNGEHTLKELGYDIIHQDRDFFNDEPHDYALVIDNPPFSIKKQVLERLLILDKPFILIMPVSTICYKYFKTYRDKIQIIIPPKRYNFMQNKSSATFDCLYFAYKMNLPRDIVWLED